jgi:hypothetical protein
MTSTTHTIHMESTSWDKIILAAKGGVDNLQNEWVDTLMALGLQDSDGKPLTEAFLREHLKVEERRAKPGARQAARRRPKLPMTLTVAVLSSTSAPRVITQRRVVVRQTVTGMMARATFCARTAVLVGTR